MTTIGPVGGVPAVTESVLVDLAVQLEDETGELVAELIDSYLAEGVGQVASLVIATLSGDAIQVASLAHMLRSSSRLLGASRLADLLQQAEDTAGSRPADLVALASPIQTEFARVALQLTSRPASPARTDGLDDSLSG